MNKLNKTLLTLALLGMIAPANTSLAEDIDIYARPVSTSGAANPNILIVIDNSANWAAANQGWPDGIKQGQAELRAVRTVASELNDKVNLGLMMFTEGSGTNKNGGYVRFKVRKMDQTNKSAFAELIGYSSGCTDGPNSKNGTPNCIFKNFNTPAEKTNTASTDYSAVLYEVFKYFGGYTSPAHAMDDEAGSPVDASHFGPLRYAGNPDAKSDRYAYTPDTDITRTTYKPPISIDGSCAKNYVIFIGNGFPAQDSPASLLSGVGGDTGQLPLNNLAVTTTTSTTTSEMGVVSCGTYTGADAAASTANCSNDDAHLATLYPEHSNFSCTLNETCSGGSPTTSDLGSQMCYADSTACINSLPGIYTGYDSYSCVASATSCTIPVATTSANRTVVADTGCIPDNLSNATNCTNYGDTNYPSYSGFSCSTFENCGSGGKKWKITATTYNSPGLMYQRRGTITPAATTYGHKIFSTDTVTVTAATPTGTFSLPAASKTRYTDEWARFLNKTDVNSAPGQQNVTTFTIDVYKDQQDANQTKLLMSMARAGGGKYFAATSEQAIMTALRKIISEIQSVNSVFASSSLPVSVNTQGTYLNQVFMGMFRPEGTAAPRWAGNLKQYEFKIFNGVLRLADKSGNEAISSTTGFVTPCATSFWSTDTGSYWNYPGSQAIGDCSAITSAFPTAGSSSIFSDLPDGEVVEKGGAAQHLRGVLSSGGTLTSSSQNYAVCTGAQTPETAQCRKLLTCDGSSAASCTSLTSFDVSNAAITATNLNIPVAGERDNTINWIRGKDIDNENQNYDVSLNPVRDEMRPSAHGGVVHSQPAVVDYGGSIGVVAFYGADDGVFHATRGNQFDTDGTELWGFIAPETYSRFHRLRDNGATTPLVSFPADPVSARPAGTARKDYFFDGSIGVYQKSGTTWIYPGMRRGGRAVYAFDVSTPGSPTLKWRKGCFTNDTANDTRCSTDVNFPTVWSGIGQTWSRPTIGYLSGYVDGSSNPKPVVIFGGGYDACEDNDSPTPCSGVRKGAQVWIVDAGTGAIIRTYPTSASVPGDISLLSNSSGFATHIYVSDINGDVYRINVGTFNGTSLTASSSDAAFVTAGWSSNASYAAIEIAQLSETNHARKFISGPDVVPYAGYNAVLIGSGDREHPLVNSYACNDFSTAVPGTFVTNQFYMIKDRPNAYPATPITPSDLTDVTSGTTTPFAEASISANGWRFDFGPCEQSVNRPLTVAGTAYFGTNTPTPTAASSCVANLGIAKGYAVNFLTGNPAAGNLRSAPFLGGGMPPSPVAGVVDVDGTKLPFIIGGVDTTAANASALQGSKVEINPTGERFRVFWYLQND
ncbi:MAG: PilC/PilY family type IV pilus protein [Rhodocyclaceae bacterium]|nr:PilC/PilY family type IV pilus protein [Rhodocyclaceae bacterium]